MSGVDPAGIDWEALEARAGAAGEFRRAYFLSLIHQGREAEEKGLAGLAARCAARVAEASPAPARPGEAGGAPGGESPLQALKARWAGAAAARARERLRRHEDRLAAAEREVFRSLLESPREDAPFRLRRRLAERLLRAAVYRRRGARLAGWGKTRTPEGIPAGPYNDFIALEQTLRRIAGVHPEWAAEFLDVYERMFRIRAAYRDLLPGAGKK